LPLATLEEGSLDRQPASGIVPSAGELGTPGQLRFDTSPPTKAAGLALDRLMRRTPGVGFAVAFALCILLGAACAAGTLQCGRFTCEQLPAPVPSPYPSALERLNRINQAVRSARYSILFFGNSLTEGWDSAVWQGALGSRDALNAGVSGDRTDHLLWRRTHGNLEGSPPKAVVLLVGTNDLAYGRSAALTADGIRANLEVLRQRLPEARILLLGLLPREELPSAPLRVEVAKVNRLVRDCADGQHLFFADIGDVLLDSDGRLTAAMSPDRLHFTARGYSLLTSRLVPELDRHLGAAR
jgi:lysophospholipase L1-like esterase